MSSGGVGLSGKEETGMLVRDARRLPLHTPLRLKDNPFTRKRWGVHAGQVLELVEHTSVYHKPNHAHVLVLECEDEHQLHVAPEHVEVLGRGKGNDG